LIKAGNKHCAELSLCKTVIIIFVGVLTEFDPAFHQVGCTGKRLNVTSAGHKLSLGGRVYETQAASVDCDHLGTVSS